jgi:hypothetical protein
MHGSKIAAKIVIKQERQEYRRGKISSSREAKIRMMKEGGLKKEKKSCNTTRTA